MELWTHKMLESHGEVQSNFATLSVVITTIWCIWFHRNQVIFEGKQANPTEVLLTARSLKNRYKQIPLHTIVPARQNPRCTRNYTQILEDWQILILTEGVAAKNRKWHGIAFIGKNRTWHVLFVGCQSLRTRDIDVVTKATTIREATLSASKQGYRKIVIFTNSKGIEKMWRTNSQHSWQLTPIFEDLKCLQQLHGLQLHIKYVPKIILAETSSLATQASKHFVKVMNVNHSV